MVGIKNGRGLLGLGTQKSAVCQEWINELGSFVACWCKFMKVKSYFNNYWVGMVKNEQGLKDRGTLKPRTSHKWCVNLAYWLNDFCMLIFACFKWYLVLAIRKLCLGKFYAKMLTTDQIAGFFKLWYLKNYFCYNVFLHVVRYPWKL